MAPANGPAWVTKGPRQRRLWGGRLLDVRRAPRRAAAIAGYANVVVPAGYVDGPLPLGISFMAGRWSEPELIALAYAWEQATEVRVPPRFLSTLGDDLFPASRTRRFWRGTAAAGDPGSARVSSCASGRGVSRSTTKPGHSAGLRAVGRLLRTRPAGTQALARLKLALLDPQVARESRDRRRAPPR